VALTRRYRATYKEYLRHGLTEIIELEPLAVQYSLGIIRDGTRSR
jgi:hypothetical protein